MKGYTNIAIVFISLSFIGYADAKCVGDPSSNQSTCGMEVRDIMVKRHSISYEKHDNVEIDNIIWSNKKMKSEALKELEKCRKKHNFCE